jgi:hypothetical protein
MDIRKRFNNIYIYYFMINNSYPKEDNQWSVLLKRQEEYYQTKLTGLHSILMSTHNALKNVTDTLSELSKVTNAPMDHQHSS